MKKFQYTEEQKLEIIERLERFANRDVNDEYAIIIGSHDIVEMFSLLPDLRDYFDEEYLPQTIKMLGEYVVRYDRIREELPDHIDLMPKTAVVALSTLLVRLYTTFMYVEKNRFKTNKAA